MNTSAKAIHRGRATLLRLFLLAVTLTAATPAPTAAQDTLPAVITIQPGDTWAGLALRYDTNAAELRALNPHMNAARQPAIGRDVTLPAGATERTGRLIRPEGGLLATAVELGLPVWAPALQNGLPSPYAPLFHRPLVVPGDGRIVDLPVGVTALELSAAPALPGMALGLWGTANTAGAAISAELDGLPVSFGTAGERFIGVVGTGAFYSGREPELVMHVDDGPAWVQPWAFAKREWEYQELTLTGEAAQIDQQARDEERALLRAIWTVAGPAPLWDGPFRIPLDSFLEISANYGARRSYNGGPYLTYHEGVDFSAYGGTPVLAPAAGTVVLAETLYVRGGTVIIDHGLGIYTGFYHMSAIHAVPGQQVAPGDLLGEVGTTGLSTGNHLHWDLLINGIWVDAAAWRESGLDCRLLEELGRPCVNLPDGN